MSDLRLVQVLAEMVAMPMPGEAEAFDLAMQQPRVCRKVFAQPFCRGGEACAAGGVNPPPRVAHNPSSVPKQ